MSPGSTSPWPVYSPVHLKGKERGGKRPHKRGKNVSLIGAIGLGGLITQVSLLGTTDGLTFEAFISQKLVPQLLPGACVLMDNCSIHKGKEIEALITAAGAKLIDLPPYSPDFSPIENCWSKIKSLLRSLGARNYPDESKSNWTSLFTGISRWYSRLVYSLLLLYLTRLENAIQ